MRFDVHPTMMKQKQGASIQTHPEKSTNNNDMYNRAFPIGNALFLFAGGMMRLPRGKFSLNFLCFSCNLFNILFCSYIFSLLIHVRWQIILSEKPH